jgi:hypothetical protein
LGFTDHLAWTWWNALRKSQWTGCAAFRATLLRYDAQPTPRPEVDRQHVQGLMTPEHLVELVEELVKQHLLLRRDGSQIQEAILNQLDRAGAWMSL